MEEVDERTFTITLNNEAARRALGVGQTRAHDDTAGTLASALDGTLNAINEELTGRDWMLWTPVGITGNSDGTPYHVTIHVKNNEKLRVIEQCANSSGINRVRDDAAPDDAGAPTDPLRVEAARGPRCTPDALGERAEDSPLKRVSAGNGRRAATAPRAETNG